MASKRNNFAQMSDEDRWLIYDYLRAQDHGDLQRMVIELWDQEELESLVVERRLAAEQG